MNAEETGIDVGTEQDIYRTKLRSIKRISVGLFRSKDLGALLDTYSWYDKFSADYKNSRDIGLLNLSDLDIDLSR